MLVAGFKNTGTSTSTAIPIGNQLQTKFEALPVNEQRIIEAVAADAVALVVGLLTLRWVRKLSRRRRFRHPRSGEDPVSVYMIPELTSECDVAYQLMDHREDGPMLGRLRGKPLWMPEFLDNKREYVDSQGVLFAIYKPVQIGRLHYCAGNPAGKASSSRLGHLLGLHSPNEIFDLKQRLWPPAGPGTFVCTVKNERILKTKAKTLVIKGHSFGGSADIYEGKRIVGMILRVSVLSLKDGGIHVFAENALHKYTYRVQHEKGQSKEIMVALACCWNEYRKSVDRANRRSSGRQDLLMV